jgi:DNA-binding SARP family transcriptional activator/tetratricopeptide (TPR) repeat protein
LVEFRILGPVELWSDGRRHDIGRAKERCVLAILAQSPGRAVSVEKLVAWVWDDEPPPNARDNLYTYVSRLRKRLEEVNGVASIATFRTGGYVLQVDKMAIDLHHFRMLRGQARAIAESGDDERALDLYRRARALLRGEPLEGLAGSWAADIRLGIKEELLRATLERIEVELRLGHHTDLVTELFDLIDEHPDNQKLVEHLMMALNRVGRQSEALEVYHRASHRWWKSRTRPSEDLQELQRRILDGDRTLLPVPRAQSAVITPRNTLPDDIRLFTGREEEIADLLELASSTPPGRESHPRVIALDGMGGVGKTVLAVHLAHRLAGEYPDGQLYLDLHGYDAEREATDPSAAVDTLLQMLGVPASRIPRSLKDRTTLWRSELASRRVLVLLDNAAGHEQIRPLLTRAPGCLTLVTSRRRLVGLDDVRSHSLDVLSPDDAARLLELAIGPHRSPHPDDLAEVVRLCDFLPLAIQLVGNRLRHRPAWTVADLAKRLVRNRRLAEIRAEDREIAAVFDLSYRGLDVHARLAFRRLGLHLGPDFTLHSAAAVIGTGPAEADRAIEDLLDHHLVAEPTEGRYRFHNLVREYARQLAESEDSVAERRYAVQRQLDHQVSVALLADRLLFPLGRRLESGLAYPPPDPSPIETAEQAAEWMAAEYQNLLITAEYAAARNSPTHIALLAHALARHLDAGGHWEKAAGLHERAVRAWRELGNTSGEARALLDLSAVRFRTGQYIDALDHARDSLSLYQSIEDGWGKADVLDHRGLIFWHQSRYRDALASSREALSIRRSLGDRHGEAKALDHIAIFLEFVGRYQEAASCRSSALSIFGDIGDSYGLQMSLNNQGDLMLRLGRVAVARGYYEDAAAAVPEMGRQHEAIWLNNMARIDLHSGRYDEANDGFRKALQTYRQIGDRRNEIETLVEIGTTYFKMGMNGEAIVHYERGLAFSREISELFEETKALRRIGEVLLSDERLADAEKAFDEALNLSNITGEPYERAKALEGMGAVYLRTRRRHHARRCWKQALRFYSRAAMAAEAEATRSLLDGSAENT